MTDNKSQNENCDCIRTTLWCMNNTWSKQALYFSKIIRQALCTTLWWFAKAVCQMLPFLASRINIHFKSIKICIAANTLSLIQTVAPKVSCYVTIKNSKFTVPSESIGTARLIYLFSLYTEDIYLRLEDGWTWKTTTFVSDDPNFWVSKSIGTESQ